MRRRKLEFGALMVLESGKSWSEADGEVCEAIDFMEYYARQMLRIADSSGSLSNSPGEQLRLENIPLGVGAVIPPWNFPNAHPDRVDCRGALGWQYRRPEARRTDAA